MRNKKMIMNRLVLLLLSILFMIVSWIVVDQFIISISLVNYLLIEIVIATSSFILDWEKKRLTKLSHISEEVK